MFEHALAIVQPDTVIRWHRTGFRAYWRWKSRSRGGRPTVALEIRRLIREMSLANPLWGAPRIHGELLKLGIDIGQTSVAKYMARGRRPPSQGRRIFLRNHADGIAAMDLFVVPTISFRLLFGLLILRHGRRRIVWAGATAHPTAEWIARQLTEACGWEPAPRYLIRDRDRAYGAVVTRRLRTLGIRDRPTSPRSPWQNAYVERLIGSVRRECIDHVVVLANGTFATCCCRTRTTTTRRARTCPSTRMRHHGAPSKRLAAFSACRSWAGCIINMAGYDLRQAQPASAMTLMWRHFANVPRSDPSARCGSSSGPAPSMKRRAVVFSPPGASLSR